MWLSVSWSVCVKFNRFMKTEVQGKNCLLAWTSGKKKKKNHLLVSCIPQVSMAAHKYVRNSRGAHLQPISSSAVEQTDRQTDRQTDILPAMYLWAFSLVGCSSSM